MKRKIAALVFSVSLLTAAAAIADDMSCTAGHVFIYNGQWYCNPGAGANGCLRCSGSTTVTGDGPDNMTPVEP
jgi:hypothetical protein